MLNLKTTLTAGIATLGLLFTAPNESQAQSFGLSLNFGRGSVSYYQDNGYAYPTYVHTAQVYREVYAVPSYGCGPAIVTAPAVVIPERAHWSPYRGWHSHGGVYAPTYSGRVVRYPY